MCCFSQIKPKDPPLITAEDLTASGMSGTFFSILTDVKQFYDYNYREVCVVCTYTRFACVRACIACVCVSRVP